MNIELRDILQAVCLETGISEAEMQHRTRKWQIADARGLFYVVAKEYGFKDVEVAAVTGRERTTPITVGKHYRGYIEHGYKPLVRLYNGIKVRLNEKRTNE